MSVDPYTREQLLSFYNFHLKKFGDRPEALRWTPQGQHARRHCAGSGIEQQYGP